LLVWLKPSLKLKNNFILQLKLEAIEPALLPDGIFTQQHPIQSIATGFSQWI